MRHRKGVGWLCNNCQDVNDRERDTCRSCGVHRDYIPPDYPLCSICRRRHPNDDRHPCE